MWPVVLEDRYLDRVNLQEFEHFEIESCGPASFVLANPAYHVTTRFIGSANVENIGVCLASV